MGGELRRRIWERVEGGVVSLLKNYECLKPWKAAARARHFPRVGTLIISRFFGDFLKKMAFGDRLKNANR